MSISSWASRFLLPCGQEHWLLESQRRTLQNRVLKAFQTKWQGRRPWSLASKGDSLGVCKAREAWGVPKSDAVPLLAGLGLQSSRYHLSGAQLIWTSGSSSHEPSYLHIPLLKWKALALVSVWLSLKTSGVTGKGVLPPLNRWGSWGSGRLCDLPQVTHLSVVELGLSPSGGLMYSTPATKPIASTEF